MAYPNGATKRYTYNNAKGGWLQKIEHLDEGSALVLRLEYERDRSGLITQVTETTPEGSHRWTYVHDDLKRLRGANLHALDGGSYTDHIRGYEYEYDRNGNRTLKRTAHGGGSWSDRVYHYNALDQLVREYTDNGTPTDGIVYEWDQLGRLTKEHTAALVSEEWVPSSLKREMTWSVDDQLLTVQNGPEAPVVQYFYDRMGTRVARSALEGDDPDLERRYLVDYQNPTGYSQVLTEYDPESEGFRRNFVFGTGHTPLAQAGSSSGPQFFQTDHLGNGPQSD
ncbi:MAG: hypothetical protein JJU11_17760 [Candidatus Sumerlaeia bacterium]|nr:hypothetical protein [Candidatus Sumerlaeia bacterium]